MKRPILAAVAVVALSGCAMLQYSEVSPRFGELNPRTIAILPFVNSLGMENANEATNNQMASSLLNAKLFDRVVDPGQVKAQMASNDELLDAITKFRSKWVATGMSDKNLAAAICKTLNADSVVFGEITQWGEASVGLNKMYRAGLALRWLDKSGEILWKAAHTTEEQGGLLSSAVGLSGIQNTMNSTVNRIVAAWPKKGS